MVNQIIWDLSYYLTIKEIIIPKEKFGIQNQKTFFSWSDPFLPQPAPICYSCRHLGHQDSLLTVYIQFIYMSFDFVFSIKLKSAPLSLSHSQYTNPSHPIVVTTILVFHVCSCYFQPILCPAVRAIV